MLLWSVVRRLRWAERLPCSTRATSGLSTIPPPAALAGAGVSAESGIPTFRGAGGLWRSFPPEALATPQAFVRRPSLVWEFYSWRREVVAACRPNRAHHALAALERRLAADGRGASFTLITQNVRQGRLCA